MKPNWMFLRAVYYKGKVTACLCLASHSGWIPVKSKNALESIAAQVGGVIARIKAEDALRESRDYLNRIINSISDPIFVKDRGHRLILVNDAACRLFGRSRDEIIYRTAYDLFSSNETANISWERDEGVFRTGKEGINEETNTYAPGVTKTVLVKKSPYTDNFGNQFLVGVTRDITDYKKAQEQVRFHASLLDQVRNAVIAADLNGNIIYWNDFAQTLFQWTSEEAIGRNIADTVVPKGKEEIMKKVISSLTSTGNYNGEFNCMRKDGTTIPTYYSYSTIKDIGGNIIGFLGVATDITDRKRAEKELLDAKEAAELASIAKSEFLANMSHEIRTPMNAVVGLTGLLLDSELSAEQKDLLRTIRTSSEVLLSVINNILDFSKIDGGKMELEKQPFNLIGCIEESFDLLRTRAAEKGLTLSYSINDSVPVAIIGDPTRLRQILANLLSNAVKFTEIGDISVRVDDLDGLMHFAVKDTGIGIPPDRIDRLFHSFSQVDSSTTRKFGGTGLGLAISKKLVEMMEGQIWAESQVGTGSIFHFTIKVEPASLASLASLTSLESAQPEMRPRLETPDERDHMPPLRILLAEDNPINQRVTLLILKHLGYRADVASNGIEVLQALERRNYDLILMDVQMPEMDGLKATQEIRRCWPKGPKIVAITAYALAGDKEKCLDAGMDGYIAKPVQKEELSKMLKEFCMKA
jgi:PAS domain S-box-containing protein